MTACTCTIRYAATRVPTGRIRDPLCPIHGDARAEKAWQAAAGIDPRAEALPTQEPKPAYIWRPCNTRGCIHPAHHACPHSWGPFASQEAYDSAQAAAAERDDGIVTKARAVVDAYALISPWLARTKDANLAPLAEALEALAEAIGGKP